MTSDNRFSPPRAAIADRSVDATEFQPIKIWSARGRIGRLRYLGYAMAGYFAFAIVTGILAAVIGGIAPRNSPLAALAMLPMLGFFVMTIFLLIQRSHDMGWSGWASLAAFIPIVGLLWVFMPGTRGANRYGPPPPPNKGGVVVIGVVLVMVAVIGILAAIALPAYQDYVKRARAAQQVQVQK